MNPVPDKYRNVINPWMTPSEIKASAKWLDKMLAKLDLPPEAEAHLLCHHLNINWNKPV